MPALLETKSLLVGYGGTAILPPLDMRIETGEFWLVVGRNGSGKTTLFKTLLGLLNPIGGAVEKTAGLRPTYVPQRNALDPLVPLRVRELVAMGCERGWSFMSRRRLGAEVSAALEVAGAAHLADARFSELSEGQKQRVLLARLLASKSDIAFLDEPTAAMDAIAEAETLSALTEMRKSTGVAVVMVTHFLGAARSFADRVLFLDSDHGVAVSGTPQEVFDSSEFRRRYGDIGDA